MLVTTPASNDTVVKDLFIKDNVIKTAAGCYIEYNMNLMTNLKDSSITGPAYTSPTYVKFKKLFPIDSMIKPFRPITSGIKYAILGDLPVKSWGSPKNNTTPLNYRIYIPGKDTSYQYWISEKGQGTGLTPLSITYPKKILVNKIVVKFEVSHDKPATWTVSAKLNSGALETIKTGTSSNIPGFVAGSYNAGVINLYYTGTSWSLNESDLNPNAYKEYTNIQLAFTAAANTGYVAVTEFSPRWVKDISSSVVDFSFTKEASSGSEDVLPVGYVSANSFTLNLNNYNTSTPQIINYSKDDAFVFDASKIYIYKQVEMKPFFKIYHSAGTYGTADATFKSLDKYDILSQGTYFVDNWTMSEFNDVNVVCLDAAKILQETIAPPILCDNYSVIAILRTLLDSIGFTSYKFNLTDSDQSIITPDFWWSDETKTVWSVIQELCRDVQMTAVVDENNILQFYTREYMYTSNNKSVAWNFTQSQKTIGSKVYRPNIIDLNKKLLPVANQVKITWQAVATSNYDKSAAPLWRSNTSVLSASALILDLNATDKSLYNVDTGDVVAGSQKYIWLNPISSSFEQMTTLNSYNGYLVVDNEIIEYDAIQYIYTPLAGGAQQSVDIMSESDIKRYRSLAGPNSLDFQSSKAYRIKTRGAFNTTPAAHSASDSQVASWTAKSTDFKTATAIKAGTSAKKDKFTNNKSLYVLSKDPNDKDIKKYSIAYKKFAGLDTTSTYYAFGTTLFFDSNIDTGNASGGFMFFADDTGLNGYYINIDTTSNAAAYGSKEFKIRKIKNGVIQTLPDSQSASSSSLNGVYDLESYKIDVFVKYTPPQSPASLSKPATVEIKAYINGFQISAVDKYLLSTNGKSPDNLIPAPDKTVTLVCNTGTINFDYIYGIPIAKDYYDQSKLFSVYNGQFSDLITKSLLSEAITGSVNLQTEIPRGGFLEEFGTVARELRYINTKYSSPPQAAYPLYASTSINQLANVIYSKLSTFGAEVYVLNNSGTSIPLDDGASTSFYVLGKTINQTGSSEYTNHELSKYAVQEPVSFASSWIQKESDAIALASWIESVWSKKQEVVNLTVFGNPFLSIGDIIAIDYEYNGLSYNTQKFVITSISHTYSMGLETTISCRTLVS
jgi:hypothetical protein